MVRNEEKFPGAQVNGSFDLLCEHNAKIFQEMHRIIRLTSVFGGEREVIWLWSPETFL